MYVPECYNSTVYLVNQILTFPSAELFLKRAFRPKISNSFVGLYIFLFCIKDTDYSCRNMIIFERNFSETDLEA